MFWRKRRSKPKQKPTTSEPESSTSEAEDSEETPNSEEASSESAEEASTESAEESVTDSAPETSDPSIKGCESFDDQIEEAVEEEEELEETEDEAEAEEETPQEETEAEEETEVETEEETEAEEETEDEEAETPQAKQKNWFQKTMPSLFLKGKAREEWQEEKKIASFKKLNDIRIDYAGFNKNAMTNKLSKKPALDFADETATTIVGLGVETGSGVMGALQEVGVFEGAMKTLMDTDPLVGLICDAIKGAYTVMRTIIGEIGGAIKREVTEDRSEVSKWDRFKEVLVSIKNVFLSIGDEILGAAPFIRSIWSAIKTVFKIVQFVKISMTRNRMVENRRKFKKKYAEKTTAGGEKYVQESSSIGPWYKRAGTRLKQAFGLKKTNQTVNKALLKKRLRGRRGTRHALDTSEKKDIRQYLIDERLRKINRRRQDAKFRETVSDGVGVVNNILSDVSFVLHFTPAALASKIVDSVNLGIGLAKTGADTLEGGINLLKKPKKQKKAIEYTGILLEHISEMDPFVENDEDAETEYEHVESDLDATGVDRDEFYKNYHKKNKQIDLLIDALSD